METIVIFTGGDQPPPALVDDLPTPDSVIAADGGYDTAVALGYRVDVLVGDLDSIGAAELPRHVLVERHPADKDATDLDLALQLAVAESPDRVVVVGGSGGRIDHELAVATLICSPRWAPIGEIDWVSGRGTAHVIRARRIIHGDVGATITLLAMGGPASGIEARGLRWELSADTIAPGSTRGVSNEFESPVADIRVGEGCLLAILAPD